VYDNDAEPAYGTYFVRVANTPINVHTMRKDFAAYLEKRAFGATGVTKDDLVVAVGEALANAAEHGYRPDGSVTLSVRVTNDAFEAHVTDDGQGFRPPVTHETPSPFLERGFGIHIMRTIMDDVDFYDGGRRVVLIKRFTKAA
jgi:anti-sigma regulatory factor (Ser/Thr protein kinase)